MVCVDTTSIVRMSVLESDPSVLIIVEFRGLTVCKALSDKCVISYIGLYKWNWIDLKCDGFW